MLIQVLESRVDHTRVVLMLRKAGNLPLVKDYLISVQKTNLSAVNEAVNELLIEEEDFEVSREPNCTHKPVESPCTYVAWQPAGLPVVTALAEFYVSAPFVALCL